MRLLPVCNAAHVLCLAGGLVLAAAAPAWAQQYLTPQQEENLKAAVENLSDARAAAAAAPDSPAVTPRPAGPDYAGSAARVAARAAPPADYVPQYVSTGANEEATARAQRLADEAQYNRNLTRGIDLMVTETPRAVPPQDMHDLQNVRAGDDENYDDALSDLAGGDEAEAMLDMRRDAQREAALSFGARGGLAKRNYEIMARLGAFESSLDKVFSFRSLLVQAPSGLLIEPPIVRESIDSLVITEGGSEAAVADRIYDINKEARIVTAPREWRQYLLQTWISRVPKPPRMLWPKDRAEQERWNVWVAQGWEAGTQQANEMFEANLNRLVADYNGMVRYRTLLAQGMISQPYAMHEDRGVTGSETIMRVGDRALRITGPSQFLTGSEEWKPADR